MIQRNMVSVGARAHPQARRKGSCRPASWWSEFGHARSVFFPSVVEVVVVVVSLWKWRRSAVVGALPGVSPRCVSVVCVRAESHMGQAGAGARARRTRD